MSAGSELRDAGVAQVSSGREDWLEKVRAFAVNHARNHGQVTINDIRAIITLPEGYPSNIWGAIFRSPVFVPVGFCQATHPDAHARAVRIYKLKILHTETICELGGVFFPTPETSILAEDTGVWLAEPDGVPRYGSWGDLRGYSSYLKAGLVHLKQEAALAHSKAMLAANLKSINEAK
jgi:hypothetical protein